MRTRLGESGHLGVRSAGSSMESLTDHRPLGVEEYTTDARIGPRWHTGGTSKVEGAGEADALG